MLRCAEACSRTHLGWLSAVINLPQVPDDWQYFHANEKLLCLAPTRVMSKSETETIYRKRRVEDAEPRFQSPWLEAGSDETYRD
eukprot:1730905-Rhodomonas_salina.1